MNKIPKIIHYIWFGNKSFSPLEKMCLDSWKKNLPDYKFILWNEKNFDINSHPYTKQAYKKRLYAFVSDYVRFFVLYKFGGIYLDTDVFVVRNFDPLLKWNAFIGFESSIKNKCVNAAVVGATAQNPFIKQVLDYYNKVQTEISVPYVVTKILTEKYGLIENNKTQILKQNILVLNSEAFYPYPFTLNKDKNFKNYITPNTFAVHLWNYSWNNGLSNLKYNQFKLGFKNAWKTIKTYPFQPVNYYAKLIYHLIRWIKYKIKNLL